MSVWNGANFYIEVRINVVGQHQKKFVLSHVRFFMVKKNILTVRTTRAQVFSKRYVMKFVKAAEKAESQQQKQEQLEKDDMEESDKAAATDSSSLSNHNEKEKAE